MKHNKYYINKCDQNLLLIFCIDFVEYKVDLVDGVVVKLIFLLNTYLSVFKGDSLGDYILFISKDKIEFWLLVLILV